MIHVEIILIAVAIIARKILVSEELNQKVLMERDALEILIASLVIVQKFHQETNVVCPQPASNLKWESFACTMLHV